MITFTNEDKRWLEITFYLFCLKIFSVNHKLSDITAFIKGIAWTNLFDTEKLLKIIDKEKIIINPNFIPSQYEFIHTITHDNCRLRMQPIAIRELIEGTNYKYSKKEIFHTAMKEEIRPTEVFPKLNEPQIHETIYSFLIALRYIADIVKKIKF